MCFSSHSSKQLLCTRFISVRHRSHVFFFLLHRIFTTKEIQSTIEDDSGFPLFVEDDPDNTVSIMLDGIESRLHMINIDVDLVCIYI